MRRKASGWRACDGTVDAGEEKAEEKVDAEGTEDGLRGRLPGCEDVPCQDPDDEEIEGDGEQAVDEREYALGVLVEQVLEDGGDGQGDDEDQQLAAEGYGPDGDQNDERADDAEGVEAGAGGLCVGVEDDGAEQEEEEKSEAPGEGDAGEALFQDIQACLRGWDGSNDGLDAWGERDGVRDRSAHPSRGEVTG